MNVSWDVIVGKDDHTHSTFAMDSDHSEILTHCVGFSTLLVEASVVVEAHRLDLDLAAL